MTTAAPPRVRQVRLGALRALARCARAHDPRVIGAVLDNLEAWSDGPAASPAAGREPSDSRLRAGALDLLRRVAPAGHAGAADAGVRRLHDLSGAVRERAVALLASGLVPRDDGPASEAIMLRLTHPDEPVRAAAARALRAVVSPGNRAALDALALAYVRHRAAPTRAAALAMLQALAPKGCARGTEEAEAQEASRRVVVRAAVRAHGRGGAARRAAVLAAWGRAGSGSLPSGTSPKWKPPKWNES
jgi:hypothetical protein